MVSRSEALGSVLPCQTVGTLDREMSDDDVARDLEYTWQRVPVNARKLLYCFDILRVIRTWPLRMCVS